MPKAEASLTEAVVSSARTLMSPGRGRELVVIPELELQMGRPDVALISISHNAVLGRIRRGLRLRTWGDAEILAASTAGVSSGHSAGHVRATLSRLRSEGWIDSSHRLTVRSHLISDSLLVEAKVSDWRGGIAQLARARKLTHRAALALPPEAAHRPDHKALSTNGIGLLSVDGPNSVTWLLQPRSFRLSLASDLWLSELVARAIEPRI